MQATGADDPIAWLAQLLKKAAPLAASINAASTEQDRERLRILVGRADYVALTVNLAQMKSSVTPCCCDARPDPQPSSRSVTVRRF